MVGTGLRTGLRCRLQPKTSRGNFNCLSRLSRAFSAALPVSGFPDFTRARVLEAARRLGYQPNAVARSLRRGRTNIIGLYTNHNYDARNDFLGTIVGALQRNCEANDLDLLLHSALNGRSPEEMLGKLRDGRIDGLILHADADDPLVALLGQSSLPVVAVADRLPGLPSITCDDADGIRQMMDFLWSRGHRRFVYLLPEKLPVSVERRHRAFEEQMAQRGVPHEGWRTIRIPYEHAETTLDQLQRFGFPCAALCWNDRSAYYLLRECLKRGQKVPEEIAVVGFDGLRDDKVPARELVTIKCPWEDVAGTAFQALRSRIERREEKPDTFEICLPVSLLPGNTA